MRRLRLFAAVLLISTWWAAPEPARAAPINDCDGAVVCLYENANQSGCRFGVHRATGDLKKDRFNDCPDRDVNDKISSFSNPSAEWWAVLYENPNGTGGLFCIPPSVTGNIPTSFNDKASSISRTRNVTPRGC